MVGDELVMDRFRLLERIGSGGMGVVYRAFDERLQRSVAVKEVTTAEPDRVLREAQAAARLNHPGIVTLYELGELSGRALLVSELVPGETLARLRADGSLCDREVGELAADLCDALAHAHARGVVHRDVKPDNVIVRDDQGAGRRAKLMDFGVARIAGAPTLTAAGEVVGTLSYMSPEQADGEIAGPESDVYSLALSLYECWAGLNPVAAATPAETARRIGEPLPSLRHFRPDLPEGLIDEIDACLEPEPECRPTAFELRECLEQEIGGLSERAIPGGEGPGARRHREWLGAGRLAFLAALFAALVLIAGPLGGPGAALVIAALCLPSLLAGASAAGLAPVAAPLLSYAAIPSAAAALGAVAPSHITRALIGAGAWAWMLAGAIVFGLGPDPGFVDRAPDGWASDTSLAADAVLAPLVSVESLVGFAVFALAGVALGALLRLRHVSVALLAAMLWAAGVNAGLAAIGAGQLGSKPLGVVGAAAIAVAVEFGILRGGVLALRGPRGASGSDPLTT